MEWIVLGRGGEHAAASEESAPPPGQPMHGSRQCAAALSKNVCLERRNRDQESKASQIAAGHITAATAEHGAQAAPDVTSDAAAYITAWRHRVLTACTVLQSLSEMTMTSLPSSAACCHAAAAAAAAPLSSITSAVWKRFCSLRCGAGEGVARGD